MSSTTRLPGPTMHERSAPLAARSWTWLQWSALGLVIGNLTMGRSFAHLGNPPLFVNELFLLVFLCLQRRWLLVTMGKALAHRGPLNGFVNLLIISGVYGLALCAKGIDAGYDRGVALKNLAFHAYPLFLFIGLKAGLGRPDFLPTLIRWLAWAHGIYGIAFFAGLYNVGVAEHPELGEASLFGDPVGSAVVLLGLLSFESRSKSTWLLFLLNLGVLLVLQVRAEMAGLFVAVVLWALLSGRLFRLAAMISLGAALLVAAAAADVRIPSPATRGGEISAQAFLGKLVAPFDEDAGKSLKRDADVDAETVAWRTGWWREIWRMVHQTPERTIVGPGYGYPLWDLHPETLPDFELRSPHNVFMYALGYTGWTGVLVFAGLQLTLAGLLWREARRPGGQAFGLCLWAGLLVKGCFENFFETPFNAIPFYLLIGLAIAPLLEAADGKSAELEMEKGSASV